MLSWHYVVSPVMLVTLLMRPSLFPQLALSKPLEYGYYPWLPKVSSPHAPLTCKAPRNLLHTLQHTCKLHAPVTLGSYTGGGGWTLSSAQLASSPGLGLGTRLVHSGRATALHGHV